MNPLQTPPTRPRRGRSPVQDITPPKLQHVKVVAAVTSASSEGQPIEGLKHADPQPEVSCAEAPGDCFTKEVLLQMRPRPRASKDCQGLTARAVESTLPKRSQESRRALSGTGRRSLAACGDGGARRSSAPPRHHGGSWAMQVVLEEAVRMVVAAGEGRLRLDNLCEAAALRPLLRRVEEPEVLVCSALKHADSQLEIKDGWVFPCSGAVQMRRVAEELFSDAHLKDDALLRGKLQESRWGEVPLIWLFKHYSFRKDGGKSSHTEFGEALSSSKVLFVDLRRATVRRYRPFVLAKEPASAPVKKAEATPAAEPVGAEKKTILSSPLSTSQKTATQLRQLLDFYFEPFTLQNNRFLLDLLCRGLWPPEGKGPWVTENLEAFSCGLNDLLGLGRIAAAMAKVKKPEEALREMGSSSRYWSLIGGKLHLKGCLEVRSFVPAEGVSPARAAAVAQSLTAAREQQNWHPSEARSVTVLSYSVGSCVRKVLPQQQACQQQRLARLRRQLLAHGTDIICLQGLDLEDGAEGQGLAAALAQEGYAFAAGGGSAIFWERSHWESICVHEDCGAAVAVDLWSFSPRAAQLRVLSMQAAGMAADRLEELCRVPPAVGFLAAADLAAMGGVEASLLLPGLAGLPSVAHEVLGQDLVAPVEATPGRDGPEAATCPLSGLNRLRQPDAVFYSGLSPIVVLSGHTDGYLATLPSKDVLQQFPAFRTPNVAAFDLQPTPSTATFMRAGGRPTEEQQLSWLETRPSMGSHGGDDAVHI